MDEDAPRFQNAGIRCKRGREAGGGFWVEASVRRKILGIKNTWDLGERPT